MAHAIVNVAYEPCRNRESDDWCWAPVEVPRAYGDAHLYAIARLRMDRCAPAGCGTAAYADTWWLDEGREWL